MTERVVDPRWPKLLSLSVHEFRTPLTVVCGYVRMLLKDRAGPLSAQQRRLLEETEKSCARLSSLLAEVSDLANLESGAMSINRQSVDLRETIRTVVGQLPTLPERDVPITLEMGSGPAVIQADATRIATALGSVIVAIRRELVSSDRLLIREQHVSDGEARHDIAIGDREAVDALLANPTNLPIFDEWRGGCGMSLPVARRIFDAHGGSLWSPPDDRKSGALIVLPASA